MGFEVLYRWLRSYAAALFLSSVCMILILLPLFQKGTFIDGQLYKTVAFNYAIDTASFWSMKFTNTSMSFFCEQPPLYPFLAGSFYKWFGTHYLVDRFFTLLLLLLFVILVQRIVKKLFVNMQFFYPLFLFFMLSVPVWCWSYVNQAIEPLVCIFVALGILSFLNYLDSKKVLHLLIFSGCLYASFLSKGFQSCFLIVLPAVYSLATRLSRTALYFAFVSTMLLGITLAATLKFYQPAAEWFNCYYNARLVLTMQNVGNTTNSHSEIIVRFFTELIVSISILIILLGYLAVNKKYPVRFFIKNFAANKLAVAFLLTAFAGSFPYAVSLVQRGFYLVPSFICFLLAILLGFKRYWLFFHAFAKSLVKHKAMQLVVLIIFIGSVFYFCVSVHAYKRDGAMLSDMETMTPYLQKGDTVLIEGETWNYFNLHSALYMTKQVSVAGGLPGRKFFIRSRSSSTPLDTVYIKMDLETQEFDLFVRK